MSHTSTLQVSHPHLHHPLTFTRTLTSSCSCGSAEMSMPQLYHLLKKLGTPPEKLLRKTVFNEFDRDRDQNIGFKEFMKGMKKRSVCHIIVEPCDFGPTAHIAPIEAEEENEEEAEKDGKEVDTT